MNFMGRYHRDCYRIPLQIYEKIVKGVRERGKVSFFFSIFTCWHKSHQERILPMDTENGWFAFRCNKRMAQHFLLNVFIGIVLVKNIEQHRVLYLVRM